MILRNFIKDRVANSAFARYLQTSFPRFFEFLSALPPQSRIPLAFGIVVAAVGWFSFFGVVQDYLSGDPLVRADLRIMYLVQSLREPAYNSMMLFLTYLGNWQVILVGSVLFAYLMYRSRQWWWLAAFAVSILGDLFLTQALKLLFRRARPAIENALLPAAGSSFPSGHALIAFAFYGFIACYAVVHIRAWWLRILLVIGVLLMIVGIGFSRIYLGVHWPSDVIASFGLGPAWVATVLILFGIVWKRPVEATTRPLSPWAVAACLAVWLGVAIAVYVSHPLVPHIALHKQSVSLNEKDFDSQLFDHIPRLTEDITGEQIEPINIIIIANDSDLQKTFALAGWEAADRASLTSGLRLLSAQLRNTPDPKAPGLPSFLDSMPNDRTYEQPTDRNSARERHHLHLWTTNVTDDGVPVWVGTVHLDISGILYKGLTYHKVDPDVDAARTWLGTDLTRSNCVKASHVVHVTDIREGHNTIQNAFFTDGNALRFLLQCN